MMVTSRIRSFLFKETSAAPLIVFRFAFGIMMFLSLVRFASNGWIDALYIQPNFFFTYYGFEWVKPLNAMGMYAVFIVMMLASLFVAFNIFYRASIVVFFLLFTYVELIDKSNYLNHYYFISIVSFLLCLLPSNRKAVPRWAILTLQLQMAIVYFFAGIAKINSDWLFQAMPLKIWLATRSNYPLVGNLLTQDWIAFSFSWCGMLFDVCIAFFLFNRKTVWLAYAVVVIFHVLTAVLFPMIGVFPFIMIVCATIFLPPTFHELILTNAKLPVAFLHSQLTIPDQLCHSDGRNSKLVLTALFVHFIIQILLPLRSHLYPDNLFYHEQGFRFSWRVMLMEKAGLVFFHIRNSEGKLMEVNGSNFLTMQQEKQMSTQPDMILQFAHHLQKVYNTNEVFAEAYVCLNGRSSKILLDPKQNLAVIDESFANKNWVLAAR